MTMPRGFRTLPTVALISAMVSLAPAPGLLAEQSTQLAAADQVAQWSERLWATASAGDSEEVYELLEKVPAGLDAEELAALRNSVERYRLHLDNRENDRTQRTEELRTELRDALAEDDLLGALKSTVELHMLAQGKLQRDAVLAKPEVQQTIARASVRAREAEEAGAWLEAYTLFNGLHLLHEEQGTYRADDARLWDRIQMLRMYVPERLHELRNERRVAEGEDPLPPYNDSGEDWRERWEGIDDRMIVQALSHAATRHIDQRAISELLVGGLDRVRTLVTTTDIARALPELADEQGRDAFIERLDRMAEVITDPRVAKRMSNWDIVKSVRDLMRHNRETIRLAPEAILHEFGSGAAAKLDEFSSFYWPDELASFNRTTEGNFTGVGIQITLNDAMELKVVMPVQGTPAARAGIRSGDIIREIDGASTLGMGLSQAVDRIIGPAGTRVTLGVEREGMGEELMDFQLTRAVIPLYSVKGWRRNGPSERNDWDWMIDEDSGIGYLRLTQFIRGSSDDMRSAIRSMRRNGLKALILDLRFNGGGLLDEAVNVANIFIPSGRIVTQEDAMGNERGEERAHAGRSLVDDLPVVVLVNSASASASEIVAGALQDYGQGLVVGERTFGKGSVQNVFMLSRGRAAFKLTTHYYKLPKGRLIHRQPGAASWGVEPEVTVEMLPQQVADALQIRQNADVMEFDELGEVLPDDERPDPSELLTGVDPQLETALLLLKSRVVGQEVARQASLR
jgi:carboxyl-terminal processing protease